MRPKKMQPIDDDITLKRPIISTRKHKIKWLARLRKAFFEWLEIALLALYEHRPIEETHEYDMPIPVAEESPERCLYCPFGPDMIKMGARYRCPKCFRTYIPTTPEVHVDEEETQILNMPVTPMPFQPSGKYRTLAMLIKEGELTTSGPLSLSGLPRLEWADGSRCDTQQLRSIRSIKKQLLIPERTGDH